MHEEKTKLKSDLNEKLWECINVIDQVRSKSKLFNAEMQKFELDIKPNYQNIIKSMELVPFNEIIMKYSGQLSNIEKFMMQTKVQQVDSLSVKVNDE